MGKASNRGLIVRRAVHTVLETLESRRLLSAGTLDTSFGSGGIVTTDFPSANADVAMAAAPSGGSGFVVAGETNGQAVIARYNGGGQRDASLGDNGEVLIDPSVLSNPNAIAVDSNGNIVVGGDLNGVPTIARFTSSGALDTSFGNGGETSVASAGTTVTGLVIDGENRIVASANGSGDQDVIRLNPDGSIDSTFGSGGVASSDFGGGDATANAITMDGDAIIVVGANGEAPNRHLAVSEFSDQGDLNGDFNGTGQFQMSFFGPDVDTVGEAVAINSSHQIVIGGNLTSDFLVTRLNADGTLDTSFGNRDNGGYNDQSVNPNGSNDSVTSMGIDSAGNIVLAGSSDGQFALIGYTPNGDNNSALGVQTRDFGGNAGIAALMVLPDGSVHAVGTAPGAGGSDFTFLGLTSSGQNDSTFGNGGVATDGFSGPQGNDGNAITQQQSDGKLVAVGDVDLPGGQVGVTVTRYLTNGALDPSFGEDGRTTLSVDFSDVGKGVAVGSDGSIYVAYDANSEDGSGDDFAVAKFNSDGTLDTSFNSSGYVRIVTPDTNDALVSMALNGNNIYLAGTETGSDGNDNFEVADVTTDGNIAFGTEGSQVTVDFNNDSIDGFSQDDLSGIAIDSSGNIVLSGSSFNGSDPDIAVARLTPNGNLDASFGNGGMVIENISLDQGGPVAVDSSNNVYVAGFEVDLNTGDSSTAVFKFDSSGNVDQTFGNNGVAEMVISSDGALPVGVAVGNDGSITVAANSFDDDGNSHFAIARFDSAGQPDSSFGSGGSTIINISDSDTANGMVLQSDGNPVMIGTTSNGDQAVARFDGGQTVVAPPPVANAGPDQTVNEGQTVNFDGSASTGDNLTYSWDLNGDGTFGDATGPTASYTYSDNGSVTVSLQVTDAEGRTSTDSLVVTINNVPPTASVSGPSSLVPGQTGTFNFGATDPSSVDQASNFTYDINWGDGTPDMIVVGTANISESHVFTTNANDTVTVKATDKDGGQSAAATTGVAINAPSTVTATTQADPLNPGQTMLVVQGTAGNDVIELDYSQAKVNKVLVQTITVMSNGVAIFSTTASISRIQVFANSGDDSVTHGGGFKRAVELYGGDGNDTLKAGSQGDVLIGGAGDDSLVSGAGNDVEIGGLGADKIVGDAGQDILISGYTAYDNDPASLVAISAEWTSTDDFATRVAALQAGIGPGGSIKLISDDSPNATVFDDGVKDTLNGGGTDSDWLLYNNSGGGVYDKAAGNTTGDVLEDI